MLTRTPVLLSCALLACSSSAGEGGSGNGGATPADSGAAPSTESGCLSSRPGRLVDGEMRWPSRLHWSPVTGQTLTQSCGAYGDDAMVTMVVDAFDGGPGRAPLSFDELCAKGEVVVELPSQLVFHGQYTVSSASTGKRSSTLNMNQDVHCNHDVYMMVWGPR